jgi:ribosomal protein L37E
MRTCPACGKDTKAETTAPCTECGFSPVPPETASSWERTAWAETSAPPEVTTGAPPQPAPAEPQPEPAPEYGLPDEPTSTPAPIQRTGKVGLVWILVIILGVVWQAIGAFDGCGDAFDDGNSANGNGVANCVNVSC